MSTPLLMLFMVVGLYFSIDDDLPWWIGLPAAFVAGACAFEIGDRIDIATGRKNTPRAVKP